MKLKINGINYYIEKHQEVPGKPTIILLHGFMGSGRGFQPLISLLKPFCNPVTIDLLGHGRTGGASSLHRFEVHKQIEDLHRLIARITQTPPLLYGYSMGGRLSLLYALKHPETISALMLESTHYGLSSKHEMQQRRQLDEKRAKAIEGDFPSFIREWQTLPLFQSDTAPSKETANPYPAIQRQQHPEQMANSLRGFGAGQMPSVRNLLPELALPVLLLAGAADAKYTYIARQMHQELPESTISIIPDAGHRVHIEAPEALASAAEVFVIDVSDD
jgi:2-succinyl-6-hydroxy-2,4-cyclohexadiene-1-carboxylate synthase